MRTICGFIVALLISLGTAAAQPGPGPGPGPPPQPWIVNGNAISYNGCVLIPTTASAGCKGNGTASIGSIFLNPSVTGGATFNLPQGTAPTSPNNGDVWTTSTGIFVRINGATVGPLVGGSSATFQATSPLAVTFPGGVVTYAIGSTIGVSLGGTGGTSFTSGLPLIGNGSSAIGTGTVSGSTTLFGTVSGSLTANDCLKSDSSHNIVDAGATCGAGNQVGYIDDFGSATFTGVISGASGGSATLTTSAVTGQIVYSASTSTFAHLSGAGITAGTVWITAQTGGTAGGAGTYTIACSSTCTNISSEAMSQGFVPGTTTTLTLVNTPSSLQNVIVMIDGVVQAQGGNAGTSSPGGYSLSGTTLTFNNAVPSSTSIIQVQYYAATTISGVGSITVGSSVLSGSTVSFPNGQTTGNTITGIDFTTRPFCDPYGEGALGNNVADDGPAFIACVNGLKSSGGGLILVPAGSFCMNNGHYIDLPTSFYYTLMGAGASTAITVCDNSNNPAVKVEYVDTVQGMFISGANLSTTTSPAFWITSNGEGSRVSNVISQYGFYCFEEDAADVHIEHLSLNAGQCFGAADVLYNNASFTYNATYDEDAPNPAAQTSCPGATAVISSLQASHLYPAGSAIVENGFWFSNATTLTTGGGAPTFPSGPYSYGVNYTDGYGNNWQLWRPSSLDGLLYAGSVGEAKIYKADITGCYDNGLVVNQSGTTSFLLADGIITAGRVTSVDLVTGQYVTLRGSEISALDSANTVGIEVSSSFTGTTTVDGNWFWANMDVGVFSQNGPSNLIVSNNQITGVMVNGVDLSNSVSKYTVTGNVMPNTSGPCVLQGGAGTGIHGAVVGNVCNGNAPSVPSVSTIYAPSGANP